MSRYATRTLRSTLQVSPDEDIKPLTTKHLHLSKEHRAELEEIWAKDTRTPSLESRRAWAEVRNIEPSNVHNWFPRKRLRTIQLGLPVSEGSYELRSTVSTKFGTASSSTASTRIKRERSPSPLLSRPVKKRRKTIISVTTQLASHSGSRAKSTSLLKTEGISAPLPVRHTRKHATNPHPACMTCIRTHTVTFSDDLPPSSPPPSSPSAVPALTFSSDPSSSDAGLESPLTPIASDGEEAEVEDYLVAHPTTTDPMRIHPPPRRLVPRSITQSAKMDAYMRPDGMQEPQGPGTVANDQEILSFSPSPSPEPEVTSVRVPATAPLPRRNKKRVRFSEQTLTFLVDPFRSDHRFSFDADSTAEDAGSRAEVLSSPYSVFALVPASPVHPAAAASTEPPALASESNAVTDKPVAATSEPIAVASGSAAATSVSAFSTRPSAVSNSTSGSIPTTIVPSTSDSITTTSGPSSASHTILSAPRNTSPPSASAAALNAPASFATLDVLAFSSLVAAPDAPTRAESSPADSDALHSASPTLRARSLYTAAPAPVTTDAPTLCSTASTGDQRPQTLKSVPLRLSPSRFSRPLALPDFAEVSPRPPSQGADVLPYKHSAVALREEEEEEEMCAVKQEEEEAPDGPGIGPVAKMAPSVFQLCLDSSAGCAPAEDPVGDTAQTLIVRPKEEEDMEMIMDDATLPISNHRTNVSRLVNEIRDEPPVIACLQPAVESLSLVDSDDEEPLALVIARQRLVKVEHMEAVVRKTGKGKKKQDTAQKTPRRKAKIEKAGTKAKATVKSEGNRKAMLDAEVAQTEAIVSDFVRIDTGSNRTVTSGLGETATLPRPVRKKRVRKVHVKSEAEQDATALPNDSGQSHTAPAESGRVRVKTEPSSASDPLKAQTKSGRRKRGNAKKAASGAPEVSAKSKAGARKHLSANDGGRSEPAVQPPCNDENDTPIMFRTVHWPPPYVLAASSGASLGSMNQLFSSGVQWIEDEFDSMELSAFCWMNPLTDNCGTEYGISEDLAAYSDWTIHPFAHLYVDVGLPAFLQSAYAVHENWIEANHGINHAPGLSQ
ncbi:uncharacterized protein B0H18DRAFT_1154692 [Fomitopsis serialis]|uniref:uncharacterized protein n=1 Tax=Fomitopsis serialis TaxID=139415 RepID=UPI002008D9AB|nr:uncharacterized protein B0H18DRAFT_1154692 [Neoantrodia serialis]KAH9929242.1 hypothetical protein B0H18DRAFT_1154692 [Neoantrodia serialis]